MEISKYASIALVVLNLQSCRENESEIPQDYFSNKITMKDNHFNRNSFSIENLVNNSHFIQLHSLLVTRLDTSGIDIELAEKLKEKGDNMNEEEKVLFVKALGFGSIEEFVIFNNKVAHYSALLEEEFSLKELDSSIKNPVITEAAMILYDQTVLTNKIDPKRYASCRRGAIGSFVVTATTCVGGGIAIGGMSFGFAAPLGGALAGACVAGAQLQLEHSLAECHHMYNTEAR